MNRLSATLAVFILVACAPLEYTPDLAQNVRVEGSEFDQLVTFHGIEQHIKGDCRVCGTMTAIRSWTDTNGANPSHQILIMDIHQGDWRFWNTVSDKNATQHRVTDISRDVVSCAGASRHSRGCLLSETFGVSLDDAFLRTQQLGFALQARSQSGHKKIITVPSGHIQAQLAAIETYRNQRR